MNRKEKRAALKIMSNTDKLNQLRKYTAAAEAMKDAPWNKSFDDLNLWYANSVKTMSDELKEKNHEFVKDFEKLFEEYYCNGED